jgi:spore cortex biosynthesis protein YabQ
VDLEAQYLTMMAMTVSGAVMGAIYDMYRVVQKEWRFLKPFGPLFDFLFWMVSLGIVFSALIWANQGDLRFYVFVILGIGYLLYRWTLQRAVTQSTMTIIHLIQTLIRMLYTLVFFLIVKPIALLFHILALGFRTLSKLAWVLEQAMLWPFQVLLKVLGWLLRPMIRYGSKRAKKPYQKLEGIFHRLSKWLRHKE